MTSIVRRWLCRVALAVIAVGLHAGCSRAPTPVPRDGGTGDAAILESDVSLPPVLPTRCGDARCDDPTNGATLDEESCCTATGSCGLRSRFLNSDCAPPHAAGSVDLTCPGYRLADGTDLQGCCAKAGQCGLNDRFGDLGCVSAPANDAATNPGDAATMSAACRYIPEATCRSVVEVTCDGPEDCAQGQECCGRVSHGQFDAFGCFVSCDVASSTTSELWFEMCRNRASCQDPEDICTGAFGLPTFLGRCQKGASLPDGGTSLDAGVPLAGETCGRVICATGEKCCLRDPLDPYCALSATRCECTPAVGD